MNRREALFRKIHPFVIGLYTVWTLWLAVYNIIQGLLYFYLLSFGGLLFLEMCIRDSSRRRWNAEAPVRKPPPPASCAALCAAA